MNSWGFLEWLSIISGFASIISLIISLLVRNQVNKIKSNINETKGKYGAIIHTKDGDVNYKINER